MSRMIGVDVGGTFTDVFVLDEASGSANVSKVPTTRPDQSGGFLDGIARQVEMNTAMGMTVEQSLEAARSLGRATRSSAAPCAWT